MAFRGKRYTFHGAFGSKAKAERRERARKNSFIRKYRIHGSTRYVVMREK